MALIKCSECGKDVSDKAVSCPHCGCPVSENTTVVDKNLEKVKVLKNVIKIRDLIISFGLCFILFILLLATPVKFEDRTFQLVEVLNRNKVLSLGAYYGFAVLIGFILSIINKKTMKASKVLYIIALLMYIVIAYLLYTNEFFISFVYIINYLILGVLIILPNSFNKKEKELYVDKKEKEKLEKKKKEEKEVKYFNKITLIIASVILLLGLIATSYLLIFRKREIKAENINSYSIKTSDKIIKVTVDTEKLKVRKCPSFDCKDIGYVIEDAEFYVLAISKNNGYRWYYIKDYEGNEGYVASNSKTKYLEVEYDDKKEDIESYIVLYEENTLEEEEEKEDTPKKETKKETKKTNYEEEYYDSTPKKEETPQSKNENTKTNNELTPKEKFTNTLVNTFEFTNISSGLYKLVTHGTTFYINTNNNSIYQPTSNPSENVTETFVEYNYRSHAGRVITKFEVSGEEIITIVEYYADISNGLVQCSTNPTKYKSAFCSDSTTVAKLIINLKKQMDLYISSAGVNEKDIYGSSTGSSYTGSLTPKAKVDNRTPKQKIVDVLTKIGYTKVDDNTYKKGTSNSYYEFSFSTKTLTNVTSAIGVKTLITHDYKRNTSLTLMIQEPNIVIGDYSYSYSNPNDTFKCGDELCPSSSMKSSIVKAGNSLRDLANQILSDAGVSQEEFNNM